MRKYRCHKVVEAGVISEVVKEAFVIYTDNGDEACGVPANFFARGTPQVGDYLVAYEDGYLSWSPKAVFEAGYSPLSPAAPRGDIGHAEA